MPTYEYKCETCGHRFEKFQRMSDAPVKICPECGGQVRRLPGAGAGVIFKGSGFYATDYARSDKGSSTRCGREQTCSVGVMNAAQARHVMIRGVITMFCIDEKLCIGCEKCVTACPAEAIIMHEAKAIIRPSKCTLCGKCVEVCPVNAIAEDTSAHVDQNRSQEQPQQQAGIFPQMLNSVGRMIWNSIGTGGKRGGGSMGRGKAGKGHFGGGGSGRGRR